MPVRAVPLLLIAAVVIAGCAATGPIAERRPAVAVPESWQARGTPGEGQVLAWLEGFRDPALADLVEEAVARNFELQAAASRVSAARTQARIAGADPLPELQVTAGASRAKRSGINQAGFVENPSNSYELRGQLSWEADLWGRLNDSTRAAKADWRAAAADYQAARLSLAANIARRWFDVIESRSQTRLARDTVGSFEKSLETIENRYRQGIGEALDVRLARNNLATARAILSQRQREQRNLVRTLETLLGRYPAGAMAQLPDTLPDISSGVPSGLPAELLERRPDLLAASARLEAAGFRLSGADKNRLPGITLTAGGGTASDVLKDLVDLDFFVWTLAANLVQPVFRGGRLAAERDLAEARDDEALNSYAQTALTAFREVEDALDSETWLVEQFRASRTAAEEARAAETLALDQYRRGLTGIITLLESQRRKFNADSALIEVINLRLQNRINLHLALGGDFASTSVPQTASTEPR
jgi:NodT family efflux transporter outer membrane factor (OMF) lipoprotein